MYVNHSGLQNRGLFTQGFKDINWSLTNKTRAYLCKAWLVSSARTAGYFKAWFEKQSGNQWVMEFQVFFVYVTASVTPDFRVEGIIAPDYAQGFYGTTNNGAGTTHLFSRFQPGSLFELDGVNASAEEYYASGKVVLAGKPRFVEE